MMNSIELGAVGVRIREYLFTVFPIDEQHLLVAAPKSLSNGDELWLWIVDANDQATARGPIAFAGEIAWVGRITGGIGVLVSERPSISSWAYAMYRIADLDIPTPSLSRRGATVDTKFPRAGPAQVIELGTDDYFVAAINTGIFGAEDPIVDGVLVSERMRENPTRHEVESFGALTTMLMVGSDARAFTENEDHEIVFDIDSALSKSDRLLGSTLIAHGPLSGGSHALAFADVTDKNIVNLRVRGSSSVDVEDAMTFPLTSFADGELALVGSFRWTTYPTRSPSLLLGAPTGDPYKWPAPKGASFIWLEADGTVRSRHTKTNALIQDVSPWAFSVRPIGTPTCRAGLFGSAWYTSESGNEHVFYGRVKCGG